MRISVFDKVHWTLLGVRILLEQLGITYRLASSPDESDIFITDEDINLSKDKIGIMIATFKSGREIENAVLEYKEASAYFPKKVKIPEVLDGYNIIAYFNIGEPGIIQKDNRIYILPNFFEYIAKITTLREFDKTFAETFSWDEFRNIFLCILEYCSDFLQKPLIRLWYYPSFKYTNSITYTTDIDYKLPWDVLKNLNRFTKARVVFSQMIPRKLQQILAIASSQKYYADGYYYRLGGISAFLDSFFRRFGIKLPFFFYFSSLYRIYHECIPITAFVRPSDYQLEENLKIFPDGTMRAGYKPERLNYVDLALHFGATIGETVFQKVNNPYKENVFKEAIPFQAESLNKQVGGGINGTRLHHVFGFNQEMFHYIDESGVIFDSSIFGTVKLNESRIETRFSPNGCTLPYTPILNETENISYASFIEIPVTAYETEKIPFELFIKNNSCIVVSEHPDKVSSPIVKILLKAYEEYEEQWWKVNLTELAIWWKERNSLIIELKDGKFHLVGLENINCQRISFVIYSIKYINLIAEGLTKENEVIRNGRLYIDYIRNL